MTIKNKTINTAVVGCGHLGRFHAEKYSKIENASLIIVCDTLEEKALELSNTYSCKYSLDYRDLVEHNIQAVSIASDTGSHFEVAKFFLANGIDVLIEKPITVSEDQARELIDLAKKKNCILQVGHVERFNPAIVKAKSYIDNPWFFEVKRIAPFKPRGTDVDVVLDLMIHDVDLLLYFVNRSIISIQAVGMPVLTKSIDVANARIEFEGGAVANITASRAAFKTERTFRIFQSNCYISLDLNQRSLKVSRLSDKEKGNFESPIPLISSEEFQINSEDALLSEIQSFVNCVENRTQPLVSGLDGLNALHIAYSIKNSIKDSVMKIKNMPESFVNAI